MPTLTALLSILASLSLGVHSLLRVHVNEQGDTANINSPSISDEKVSVSSGKAIDQESKSAATDEQLFTPKARAQEAKLAAIEPVDLTQISGAAMGVLYQRSAGYYNGDFEHTWTDVCFIQGATQVDCTCRGNEGPGLQFFTKNVIQTFTRPAYESVKVRTRFIDAMLHQFLPRNKAPHAKNAQVVNLGAGYDGRFYSMNLLKDANLFEMDQVATQEHKKMLVSKCKMKPVNNRTVHYLQRDDDASNTSVFSALASNSDFHPSEPTLFLLENVAQYVDQESLSRSLKALSQLMKHNSQCFLIVTGFEDQGKYQQYLDQVKNMPPPFGDLLQPRVMGESIRSVFPPHPADKKWFEAAGWTEFVDPYRIRDFKDLAVNEGAFGLYMNIFKVAPASKRVIPGLDKI